MAMTSATAPGTLAGTLAQENAEILAGLVVTQLFARGTPVMYGGIPHIMDPRTSICSFGSPEQGLMAVAMVQMARFYGLPLEGEATGSMVGRYDTQNGLAQHLSRGERLRRIFRPRVLVYTAVLGLIVLAFFYSLATRQAFKVDVVRDRAALARGMVLRPLGDVLYWMPPYCVDDTQLELLAQVTRAAIDEATA